MIANASSGLEPNYGICFIKNVLGGTEMLMANQHFEKVARERGFYSEPLMREIAMKGSIQNIRGIPEDVKKVFVTAFDIAPEWHVRMQAAFQKYVDSSISKTINFPSNATIEDVEKAYMLAYDSGCKGITVYRHGSMENQVLDVHAGNSAIVTTKPRKNNGKKKCEEC